MPISYKDIKHEKCSIRAYIRERTKQVPCKRPDLVKGDCWQWLLSINNYGYGHSVWHRTHIGSHRLSYFAHTGAIPIGMDIDHLCRNRACCNPKHLEPVTRKINLLRGETIPAANSKKAKCPAGHLYSEFGRIYSGSRSCRECLRIKASEYYYRVRRPKMQKQSGRGK